MRRFKFFSPAVKDPSSNFAYSCFIETDRELYCSRCRLEIREPYCYAVQWKRKYKPYGFCCCDEADDGLTKIPDAVMNGAYPSKIVKLLPGGVEQDAVQTVEDTEG